MLTALAWKTVATRCRVWRAVLRRVVDLDHPPRCMKPSTRHLPGMPQTAVRFRLLQMSISPKHIHRQHKQHSTLSFRPQNPLNLPHPLAPTRSERSHRLHGARRRSHRRVANRRRRSGVALVARPTPSSTPLPLNPTTANDTDNRSSLCSTRPRDAAHRSSRSGLWRRQRRRRRRRLRRPNRRWSPSSFNRNLHVFCFCFVFLLCLSSPTHVLTLVGSNHDFCVFFFICVCELFLPLR